MATKTGIEWTDYSINLIRYRDADNRDVWACVKCSDGCKHCYAESLAHRFRRGKAFTAKNMTALTPYFDDKAAAKLLRSRKLTGKRVFVGDMTDVFGPWVPFDLIDKLFAVMSLRPDVTFQVLTKRPERMAEYFRSFSPNYQRARIAFNPYIAWPPDRGRALDIVSGMRAFRAMKDEPLPNVWLGCSIEDQKTADERIPHLLRCSAAVRFLSCEPMLGAVDLTRLAMGAHRMVDCLSGDVMTRPGDDSTGPVIYAAAPGSIDWVIVGGESGSGARPCNIEWIRSIVGQCKAAGVACFVKQIGSRPRMNYYDFLRWCESRHWDDSEARIIMASGAEWRVEFDGQPPLDALAEFPNRRGDGKGSDPAEWPDDLRVREMPEANGIECASAG